jgi:hypothetical protein
MSIGTKYVVAIELKFHLLQNLLEHKKINAIRQKKVMLGSFS